MIVAKRDLFVLNEGSKVTVQVSIDAPRFDVSAWIADYSIAWPEGTFKHHGMGMDSVQALFSALRYIAIHVYASPYHKAGTLLFDTPGGGYGFPLPFDSRDLAIGLDKTL